MASLAAAFAFSAPALAQDSPEAAGDTSTEVAPGATDGGTSTESTDDTTPPAEPDPTPSADEPDPPAPDPPADPAPPAEGTPPDGSADPADTSPPAETCAPPTGEASAGDASGTPSECQTAPEGDPTAQPDADCADGATAAQPVANDSGDPGADCPEVAEPGPAAATAPPAASAAATAAPQQQAPAPAPLTIVILIVEPAAESATPTPQGAELANHLLPSLVGLAALPPTDSTADVAELESATIADALEEALDADLVTDALWLESLALANRRLRGSCAALARSVPLSSTCTRIAVGSVLGVAVQRGQTVDGVAALPPNAARAAAYERQRRTHREARSDTAEPAVAVAPAASRPDSGIGVSGGSPGGSASSATSRIFAVSTLPLSLAAPASFPTEPQPMLLPDGELGVSPPASPG